VAEMPFMTSVANVLKRKGLSGLGGDVPDSPGVGGNDLLWMWDCRQFDDQDACCSSPPVGMYGNCVVFRIALPVTRYE
jgi:hypothetical protein